MIELIGTALTLALSFLGLIELAKKVFQGEGDNDFQFWFYVVFVTLNLILFFRNFKIWWQL